jgi:plasmid stabilization system protein ParE
MEAVQEIESAKDWYAAKSPAAASAFLDEVDYAFQQIKSAPRRCPKYVHGTRRYRIRRYPYLIIFRERTATVIEVVAVAHTSRRPGYWRHRLSGDGNQPR